jgi:hypothetical protein
MVLSVDTPPSAELLELLRQQSGIKSVRFVSLPGS